MSNEHLEFIRIFAYLGGVTGLLYLGVIVRQATLTLHTLAAYFGMWGSLLVVQINHPDVYRQVANYISTPSLVIMVLLIFYNLWLVRKD